MRNRNGKRSIVKKCAVYIMSFMLLMAFMPEITYAATGDPAGDAVVVESQNEETPTDTDASTGLEESAEPDSGESTDEAVDETADENETDTEEPEPLLQEASESVQNESDNADDASIGAPAEDGTYSFAGEGSETSPYQIATTEDFLQMVAGVNSGELSAKYFVLAADISLEEENIAPMGSQETPFTGSFDGQGYKITGFRQRLTADDGNYGGLFGYANNATIKNVTMESVNINNTGSQSYVGGVVGYMNNGTLEGCKVLSGSVASGYAAGGIAGYIYNASEITLTGFENGATVSGTTYAGGILGEQNRSVLITLTRMKNTGTVNGGTAGGIVGKGYSSGYFKVANSYNSGAVTGTEYAGGIAGLGIQMTDCENTGKIQAATAGGLAGSDSSVSKSSNKGYITGTNAASGISYTGGSQCYNTGTVECTAGGIAQGIGRTGTNCYNTGKIISGGYASGISYVSSGSSYSENCYNVGVINGKSGSYAVSNKSVTNCYYLENRGIGTSGATSLTAEQMESQDSFAGFNFAEENAIWTMAGIEEYPFPELSAVEMTDQPIDAVEQIKSYRAINEAIAALPETVALLDEPAVIVVRSMYDQYVETYGEDETVYIQNYDKLTAAEATIAELKEQEKYKLENAVIADIPEMQYTGEELKPAVTVTIFGESLKEGEDFKVSYTDNVVVGTAKVTITGNGEYQGTVEKQFTIVPATVTVPSAPEDLVYNGTAQTGVPGDQRYEAADNTAKDAGEYEAVLTLKDKDNYTWEDGTTTDKKVSWSIARKSIAETEVEAIPAQEYSGEAITPALTVTDGTTPLTADTDFTIKYENNVNAGTAKVTISGKGNYTGNRTETFSITPVVVEIPAAKAGLIYNGTVQTGVPAGEHYVVAGNEGKAANSYTATVSLKDKKNYVWSDETTEDISITWEISKASIVGAEVTGIEPKTYTGSAITQDLTVKLNGRELDEGTDYTVAYSDNTNVGIATLTITGKGSCEGTVNLTFEITSRSGWQKDGDTWHYYNEDGTLRTYDWAQNDIGWCYLGSDGAILEKTQWVKYDGGWYHITKGYRDENKWMKDSKGWCWLQADGRMLTNGWAKDSKGWCWIASNGYMPTTTQWVKYDGGWYHITQGYRDQNKWMKDSKGWCWLQADGRMLTNGWAKDSKGWCWIASNGYMPTTTQWVKYDGGWYHITKGYRDQSKWMKDSKGWCWLQADGRMLTNGWAKDSKGWCWIGPDGYMIEKNQWVDYNGGRYYIIKGYRVTGTHTIDGVTYTFDANGRLVE